MDPRTLRLPNMLFTLLKPGKVVPPNTAVFKVPLSCNKFQIKNYLEQIYRVKVKDVRTLIYIGDTTHVFNHRMRIKKKKLPDWKKAYVSLEGTTWKYPTKDEQKTLNNPKDNKK